MSTIASPSPQTPAPPSTGPSIGTTVRAYSLQLLGEESRHVELGSQPVMIGSGPRCAFRLDAPGAKPVHCVVSLGEEGPVVRRWAEGTLLNGESFTEALLTEGDRLTIGSVHLEVHHQGNAESLEDRLPENHLLDAEEQAAEESSEESSEESLDEPAPQESAPVAEADDFDPAVPRHLLTPWQTEESADEQATPKIDSEPEVVDWIGGKSEWTSLDETDSSHKASDEEAVGVDVVVPETECKESNEEAPLEEASAEEAPVADVWAVESISEASPVEETVQGETVQEETLEPSAELVEAPLSEEVSAWIDNNVREESASDEPKEWESFAEEPTADDLETATDDFADELSSTATVASTVDTTVDALRARLLLRAERLRRVVVTLRAERAQTEHQATASLAAIEQLQAGLANAELQSSEGAASLAALQEELALASARIETLEAELCDAIEASATAAQEVVEESATEFAEEPAEEPEEESVVSSLEETQETEESAVETSVETSPSAEELPECEEEASVVPELTESVETPITGEQLWGIESLAPETASELATLPELTNSEEPQPEPMAEVPVAEVPVEELAEEPIVELAKELTGSLDDVLLPGETFAESPVEMPTEMPEVSLSSDLTEEASVVAEANDGSSVLASLMTPLSQESPSGETEATTEEHVEPESFIDRFAHLLPEESDEETLSDSIVSPLPVNLQPELTSVVASGQATDEEGEESIDDYMKKMMDRIRGEGGAPMAGAPKVSQPVQVKAAPVSAPVAEESVVTEPKQAPIQNLDEMKRSPTRALGADLGELRQLANQSARRAIDVAETKDRQEHANLRLIVAGVGVTCGLLACMTAPSLLSWQLYGGLGGIVGGGYLGLRTLKVIQHSAALNAKPTPTSEVAVEGAEA